MRLTWAVAILARDSGLNLGAQGSGRGVATQAAGFQTRGENAAKARFQAGGLVLRKTELQREALEEYGMNVAALHQRSAWQRRTFELRNAVEKRDAVASTADDSLNRIFQRGLPGHLHAILPFAGGSPHSVLDRGLWTFVFSL